MPRNGTKRTIAAMTIFGVLVSTMASYFSYPSVGVLSTPLRRMLHGELEEDGEEEELDESLLSTSIMVIVLTLILLTVAFEEGKEYIEEAGGRKMKPIIDSLFGEMTVLGFLSCVTFVVTKCGVFSAISERLFGEEELLVEVFETVHFTLFFIMIGFVIQVLILLKECNKTVDEWNKMEADSRDPDVKEKIMQMAMEREMQRRKMRPKVRRHASFVTKLPAMRNKEAEISEDHFLFDSLRDEFLKNRSLEPPFQEIDESKRLSEDDFTFGRYLAICLSNTCSKIVEVSTVTWSFFAAFTIVIYIIDIALDESGVILSLVWVCLGYLFVLFNSVFENYLIAASKALALKDAQLQRLGLKEVNTPKKNLDLPMGGSEKDHLLSGEQLNNATTNDSVNDENLPTWCRIDMDDYMKNRSWLSRCLGGKRKPNRNHALLWLEAKAPKLHVTILQINLVYVGLYSAMLILTFWPSMYRNFSSILFFLYVVLSIFPAVALVTNKRRLVASVTQIGCVGAMRKHPAISRTVREEKTASAVRALIFMYKINRLSEEKDCEEKKSGVVPYKQVMSKVEIHDITKTFELFDESGDGLICHAELDALVTRFVGSAIESENVQKIVRSLDSDSDGEISLEEFLQWYADNLGDDGLSTHEKAKFLFGMFDKEGDGQISIGEFKEALDALNLGFTVDEIGEIVRELDEDGDGVVSEEEFAELIELYYPKELETEEE